MNHTEWIWGEQPLSYSASCPHHVRAINELWPIIERTQAQRILDAGAGCPPSALAEMLRGYGKDVVTMDGQADADIRGDLQDMPISDNSFDLVVSRHSLEHCVAPLLALREFRRVAPYALVVLPNDCLKFMWWQGHFSVFPRHVWEHLFLLAGWGVSYFAEGDFSQLGGERDIEWRYLLTQQSDWVPFYEENGRYMGNLSSAIHRTIAGDAVV